MAHGDKMVQPVAAVQAGIRMKKRTAPAEEDGFVIENYKGGWFVCWAQAAVPEAWQYHLPAAAAGCGAAALPTPFGNVQGSQNLQENKSNTKTMSLFLVE